MKFALAALALVAIFARLGESADHPFAIVRVVFSILAVGYLIFGPPATLGRRAIAIVALEAMLGVVTFAFVDAPFVLEHQRQIEMFALSATKHVARAERAAFTFTNDALR